MTLMKDRAEAAGIPIHHFDLQTDERFATDPFGVWDEIRDVGPLFYSTGGRGFFVVTDYDYIKTVMQDHQTWSNSPTTITYTAEEINMSIVPENMDPPVHTSYKRAVTPLLSPSVAKSLDPLASEIINDLIDGILERGECEFISEFAQQLPSRLFLTWLGLGTDDADRMFQLATQATDMESQEQRASVERQIDQIIIDLLEARRLEPKDDLATQLVNLKVDGKPIEQDKLVSLGGFLFVGGQDTTMNILGISLWHLARHPTDRDRLAADPDLIPQAIEEIIRYYSTVGPSGRTAKAYGELEGLVIEPGDRIFIARTTADRALFDSFEIDRDWNKHCSFGLGPHRCVGSHVARMELKRALELWLERIPVFSLPEGFQVEFIAGSMQQNIARLPLVIGK